MLSLMQPLILPFFCHRLVTRCQNESNKVSNSKSKPELCTCVKTRLITFVLVFAPFSGMTITVYNNSIQ